MSANEQLMRIGELARRTDRTVRALRLYEEVGLLVPAKRTDSGYRMYDGSNVERLNYIDRLQRMGLSLNEICGLVEDWNDGTSPREAMNRVKGVYAAKVETVRARIAELSALEAELVQSLSYLEGCCDCTHTTHGAESACGPCVKDTRSGEETPALITGLTAH